MWLAGLLGLASLASAQDPQLCGTLSARQSAGPLDERGGIHITAQGTLRVLIVFASFPDDEMPNPYWPAHSPPRDMGMFIDPDTTRSPAPFNLTNYFRQMSLGQFHFIGDAIWVETSHASSEYLNGSFGRANTSVLQERVDPIVDFTQYDNWTNGGDYVNLHTPDGQVDMIIMVWRTNLFEFVGEASLGYKPAILADGKRIEMGFPDNLAAPLGSGVTCEYLYGDDPLRVMKTIAHEVGHWLLGGAHPYNGSTLSGKHQYWGMLCPGQRTSSCANAYEREKLGWITIPDIPPDSNLTFPDYVRTGTAYKFHPPNGEAFEYFYIENHQLLSPFDDVTVNPNDKGIWILHQEGPYMEMDNLRIDVSDGRWDWTNPGLSSACFSQQLPVFRRGTPDIPAGESHRDQIPTGSSLVNWMYVYEDPPGGLNCGAFLAGMFFNGAFNASSNNVFSPFSNPGSNTWNGEPTTFSLEILSELNGLLTVRSHVHPLDAVPAHRYLGVDPAHQATSMSSISLAWGAQWSGGQPIETNVNWSELERTTGDNGIWSKVYQGPSTVWRDSSFNYDSSGTVNVTFRVRVSNSQGKFSTWSNTFHARASAVTGIDHPDGGTAYPPDQFLLEGNYPNPFNPNSDIRYHLPALSNSERQAGISEFRIVRLSVFDLLGREVAVLVNEMKAPGKYEVKFDGSNLASGVYLCRLQVRPLNSAIGRDSKGRAGNFIQTRKMLIMK